MTAGNSASAQRELVLSRIFDAPPDRYEKAKGFSVSFSVDTPADAERIFQKFVGRPHDVMFVTSRTLDRGRSTIEGL